MFPIPYLWNYIQLTNGGGVGEAERCKKLTGQLGVKV